jgi:hypothetical protein
MRAPGALDGLDHTGKLGQEPVAHELYDAATTLGDLWLYEFPPEGLEALKCATFICTHKTRIADYISGENSGKPTFQALSPSPTRLAINAGGIHAFGMKAEWRLLARFRLSEG